MEGPSGRFYFYSAKAWEKIEANHILKRTCDPSHYGNWGRLRRAFRQTMEDLPLVMGLSYTGGIGVALWYRSLVVGGSVRCHCYRRMELVGETAS